MAPVALIQSKSVNEPGLSSGSMKSLTLDIVIEREDQSDSAYSSWCNSLPGCYSAGYTADEASARMAEAIESHLLTLLEHNKVLAVAGQNVRVEQLSFMIPG